MIQFLNSFCIRMNSFRFVTSILTNFFRIEKSGRFTLIRQQYLVERKGSTPAGVEYLWHNSLSIYM